MKYIDILMDNLLHIFYTHSRVIKCYKELKSQWMNSEYTRMLSIILNASKHPCF